MRIASGALLFSPSDLISFMESPFASHMERRRLADRSVSSLIDPEDPLLNSLRKRGYDHEEGFLSFLKSGDRTVTEISRASNDEMLAQTRQALSDGPDVIAQAFLELDDFSGFADFLVKVPGCSKLGDYHYEVWDTKLSRKMKPYFAIQLCCYAEMLENEQGRRPENVAIVLGDNKTSHLRVADYFGYYRNLKASFVEYHKCWKADKAPDPAENVSHGRWSQYARKLLNNKRHLSLVAGISRTWIKRLETAGIMTIDELANVEAGTVPKLNKYVLERLISQAELQIASEGQERPLYEVIAHEGGRALGLALLPPHSDMDVFFDIEGYPLIDGGLEYLWGATFFMTNGDRSFRDFWAHDPDKEKQAFTNFIDWIYERWTNDPSMHVFHYASYEVTALRRLMGRYGVREHEVDTLLRNEVFVDLYNIVRNGVRVGEPAYSIKNIEHLYREKRDTDVSSGGESVVVYEEWRGNPDGATWEASPALEAIRNYNIDDCNSTQELAQWLRAEQEANGIDYIVRSPEDTTSQPEEETSTTLLRDKLLKLSEQEQNIGKRSVHCNLAWLLEFHNRENKPTWWRLFDRLGLSEAELHEDMDCLVGLRRTDREPFLPAPRARNSAFEYSFDANQPFKGQARSFYVLGETKLKVKCIEYDPESGNICIQSATELPDRISLIPDEYVSPAPIPGAVERATLHMMETDFSPSAVTDFLFRKQPRFVVDRGERIVDEQLGKGDFLNSVVTAANTLDNSYLCIQGPPGSGKTFTARHIIADLLAKGKRVGISSNSHKAIINLMSGVADHLLEHGIEASLIKVGGGDEDPIFAKPNVKYQSNARACENELGQTALCIGGTAWLFCNDTMSPETGFEPLDFLFVDEAGQVSLANFVGMSGSARNLVLMGDQMQLSQPSQGSHPEDSGRSVLEYLLQDSATIAPDMGIFLPRTYRMHPNICSLISNQVYDGRLHSDDSTSKHLINVPDDILPIKAGIHFVPVHHTGNTQGSEEEVKVILELAAKLVKCSYWPKATGEEKRVISLADILFIAPYNYQVNLLRAALGAEARVGSVDRFQGQEAPIVILSMCASDASESPRGIDFLFSKNRLNVAISRAESLTIVVGSPQLASTPVSNLRQMELINFFAEVVSRSN
jgi:predicted RecB family nuclease